MVPFGISTEKVKPKILINIGCLMDIPTGFIVTGKKGESIINGGLPQISGLVGRGNNYKSTIMHYMALSAYDKISASHETNMVTYDTEMNTFLERLEDLSKRFEHIPDDIIRSNKGLWTVTDKSQMPGNKFALILNEYSENKIKDKDSKITIECFKDPYEDKPLSTLLPSFVEIDSLSEFEAESTIEMLSNDLDGSDTNTFAMKQGLFKSKFLSTLPRLASMSNTFILFTGQVSNKINMATGPAAMAQPVKDLQYLKQGDSIKGISNKFFFLLNSAWFLHTASLLKNKSTEQAEYPVDTSSNQSNELNVVKLTQLRSKSGSSGYTISVIVSQDEGVLPTLTEFHHIKENNRFGLSGNNVHYNLDIYPDVSLSRTTIRNKIDNDPRLRRAINITSELLQLSIFNPELETQGLMCTPKELYEDIKKLGYDWNVLLDTRGYWTIDQYTNKVPFLSTVDLLKMRKGLYTPYFLKDNKEKK